MTEIDIPTDADLWVFAYGSLMWRPGFEAVEQACATVDGYHRALCIESHRHRGTPERPGLVLGLDQGGTCCGVAFRAPAAAVPSALAHLRERELVTGVYLEVMLPVTLADGRRVSALAYVVDREHAQYVGLLSHDETLRRVSGSVGLAGPNVDYVLNTARELDRLGVPDTALSSLASALTVSTDE
ncbi:gamma-glutamylcyclotransferase [Methylopila sp. M107]|uniref:gamma-glutamylcyclotransferase n=1 Tax=Methylopila sp. M107 TaxID=1101190 RepID=UPI00058EBE82|nr:gamma-glutamylcyclotransferase [Methylopila sp. M107]